MDVTARLLRVFNVDKMLRSLQSRLKAAEGFLATQDKDIAGIDAKRTALETQLKTMSAQAADHEGETKRLDAKMAGIRTQMESAQTNKEYKAFLTELNTYKTQRDNAESSALELMGKVDELKKQVEALSTQRVDREQVRKVASTDREQRHAEISGRLAELQAERASLIAQVPPDVMVMFQRLLDQRGEEAMGPVEVQDRRRHEFTCGVCMMSIPIELVNGLLVNGALTRCRSCQCVLFLDEETVKSMQPEKKGEKPEKKKAAPKGEKKKESSPS